MHKVLNEKSGMVLVMIVIIASVVIVVMSTLATLAYHNYIAINTHNKKVTAYYVADQGMEKTIKNLETIIESAKIYANEKLNLKNIDGVREIDNLGSNKEYRKKFTEYYAEFINGDKGIKLIDDVEKFNDSNNINKPNDVGFRELDSAKTLWYGAVIEKNDTDTDGNKLYIIPDIDLTDESEDDKEDYKLNITVTGWKTRNSKATFVRKVYAEVGISPWGYGESESSSIEFKKDEIYSSPQWTNALASSGDIVINDGKVTVNGDIYVNGFAPTDDPSKPQDARRPEGTEYGGLIVGYNRAGHLLVNGNVFTDNYVHTMYPGSTIEVRKRANITSYDVDKIYEKGYKSTYSEKAENLNSDSSSDPLELGSDIVNILGEKQVDERYIDYLKNTYYYQKKHGGFVYANNIQIEQEPFGVWSSSDQLIEIDGSAIVFDNLQVDGKGKITVGNNFYGFREEARLAKDSYKEDGYVDYNQSSSIVVNNPLSKIDIGQRIYNAGIAYVTAYGDPSGTGKEPYETGETASIFKNYYSYRNPLPGIDYNGKPFSIVDFSPFRFVYFKPVLENYEDEYDQWFENRAYKIGHVFKYDTENNTGLSISKGGSVYDKDMIILNDRYNTKNLLDDKVDMGYSRGILMGHNGTDNFIGVIKPDIADPYGNMKLSKGSLSDTSFRWYIKDKYATLMEVKALKSMDNNEIKISDLVDTNIINSINSNSYSSPDGNFIVSNQDITIGTSGESMTASFGGAEPKEISNNREYNGLIVTTGKVTINSDKDITINGAIISAKTLSEGDSVSIEFLGSGTKTINYDRQLILNIYTLVAPNDDNAEKLKTALTSKRGIVAMFNKVYDNGKDSIDGVQGFKAAVDKYASRKSLTKDDAITQIANMYELTIEDIRNYEKLKSDAEIDDDHYGLCDKLVLSTNVVNNYLSISNNYKIFKWKAIQ